MFLGDIENNKLLASYYTSWRYQKNLGFLMFSGGIKEDQWYKVGFNHWGIVFLNISVVLRVEYY